MSIITPINDIEVLYRSVRESEILLLENKKRVSSSAFNDRKFRPSVDIASLRNFNPQLSKLSDTDYIVELKAGEVRKESIFHNNIEYKFDVQADPLPDNEAHAIITTYPVLPNENAFRKLKDKLARMATIIGFD